VSAGWWFVGPAGRGTLDRCRRHRQRQPRSLEADAHLQRHAERQHLSAHLQCSANGRGAPLRLARRAIPKRAPPRPSLGVRRARWSQWLAAWWCFFCCLLFSDAPSGLLLREVRWPARAARRLARCGRVYIVSRAEQTAHGTAAEHLLLLSSSSSSASSLLSSLSPSNCSTRGALTTRSIAHDRGQRQVDEHGAGAASRRAGRSLLSDVVVNRPATLRHARARLHLLRRPLGSLLRSPDAAHHNAHLPLTRFTSPPWAAVVKKSLIPSAPASCCVFRKLSWPRSPVPGRHLADTCPPARGKSTISGCRRCAASAVAEPASCIAPA
jgi:hypothetical protein